MRLQQTLDVLDAKISRVHQAIVYELPESVKNSLIAGLWSEVPLTAGIAEVAATNIKVQDSVYTNFAS